MATPNEKLAASLAALKHLQKAGRRVFRSNQLGRVHRERLLKQGFLKSVIKGWLISSSPSAAAGDTTSWFASFWEFCAFYCAERFDGDWHLSPEQSLLLLAENTVIPKQVIVYSPKGTNNTINLPFGTSIFDLKQIGMPRRGDIAILDGLRLFAPHAALLKVPEGFFARYPLEAQIALADVRDSSDVLPRLLEGGHSVIAGRLAGAFRRIGRAKIADEILAAMKAAGYDVRETDPFAPERVFAQLAPAPSPIVGRIQGLWEFTREVVVKAFPKLPGLPANRDSYMKFVDGIYASDAYHSLSIEGYRVTPELIERVRSGAWIPAQNEADQKNSDALAARGYWQAFQKVKEAVSKIIAGANPGALVRNVHGDWHRELFQPSVAAGIVSAAALAGYRRDPVYLRNSWHVPPRSEAVRDAMPALFDLLEKEPEPSVRAVLGHWLFGYIHPYPDGNGRMARFLMNAMLASGGYPWTVIRAEDRTAYLAALERASVDVDIRPFADFIAKRVEWSLEQAPT